MKSTRKLISSLVAFCMIIQLGSAAVFADTTGFDLQAAIDAAENGATIVLEDDVNQNITIPADKEITIDLNDYTITGNSTSVIENSGILHITGSGSVLNLKNNGRIILNTNELYIDGGTYVSEKAVIINNQGIAVINDATLISSEYSGISNNSATLTIGGKTTISAAKTCITSTGPLTINGGEFTGDSIFDVNSSVTINNGKFISTNGTMLLGSSATVQINKGTLRSKEKSVFMKGVLPDVTPVEMGSLHVVNGTFIGKDKIFGIPEYRTVTERVGSSWREWTQHIIFTDKEFNGGIYSYGTGLGIDKVGSIECLKEIPDQVEHDGGKVKVTDVENTSRWYTGSEAINAVKNAETGSKITFIDGTISTRVSHDVTITVLDGATAVINGSLIPSGTEDHSIHFVNKETYTEGCLSSDVIYYRCTDCGKFFEDGSCLNEITDLDAYIASHAVVSHTATLEPRVEPTYDADGHEAYYICSKCNKMFSDEECTHEIDAPVVIPRIQDEISDDMIQAIPDQEYEGTAVTPAITVKDGETTLTKDTDYTVSFANNDSIGTATVTVTGMGRYKGTATASFTIVRNASNFKISKIDDQVWTGSSIFPPVVVKDGNKTLEEGVDYIVNYSSNVNVGDATVTVTGLGFFTGTTNAGFRIVRRPITLATIDTISSKTYKGEAIRPSITVRDGNKVLTPVDDYTVDYDDNIDAGTATVTVTGVGNYCEELETTFTITGRSIIGASIESIPDQTFTGSAIKPAVTVKLNGATLTKDTDYTVTYSENINAGQATVTVKGIGNNSGEKTTTFDIMPKSKNELTIRKVSDQEYTGEAITPTVTIYDGDTKLIKNEDYTLTYDDSNVKVGSSEIMIKFKGNYSGTAFTTFNIVPVTLSKTNISAIDDQVCTGKKLYPDVTVKVGTKVLTEGKDYDIEYSDNTDVGTATVTVQGKGNYEGKAVRTFEIVATVITKDDITPIEDQLYTGSAITPAVTVKIGSTKLVEGTDYDVAYEDNVEIGVAKAIVTGKGKYAGEITIQFAIVKPGVTYEWKQSGGEWYYVDSDGNFTKGLAVIDGSTYYFDDSGKMLTGWQTIDGVKHYFNTKNGVMATGITKISSKLYWLDDEGAIKTGWYTDDAGKKYYFTSSGAVKDAKKISGKYYLFDKNFVMLKSGWKKDSKGDTYKLDSKGVAAVKKWAKKSGKWYYFGSNGKMVKGKSLKIGKKTYKFKSNGVCTNK